MEGLYLMALAGGYLKASCRGWALSDRMHFFSNCLF